jgi:hypothetical protein
MVARRDIPEPEDANFEGSTKVWLPNSQWNERLVRAIESVRPPWVTVGFNYVGEQVWFMVSQPADTRVVYQEALEVLRQEREET